MYRRTPYVDLLAVVCWLALVGGAALLPGLQGTPVVPALSVPFLLVGPGYAVVAALFPERTAGRQLGVPGRLVLSFGASVGVVVTVGLLLDFSVFGFARLPVLSGVAALTLAAVGVALWRRRRVAEPAGLTPSTAREWVDRAVGTTPLDAALSGAVVVAVLIAAGAVYGLPAADPTPQEAYLLTPGPDGPVADDYPQQLRIGEPVTLILGAESGTDDSTPVTAVVSLQRTELRNGEVVVTERTELRRLAFTEPAGGTAQVEHTVTPTRAGDLRLAYGVYFGPGEPTGEPDRRLTLQVTVTAA